MKKIFIALFCCVALVGCGEYVDSDRIFEKDIYSSCRNSRNPDRFEYKVGTNFYKPYDVPDLSEQSKMGHRNEPIWNNERFEGFEEPITVTLVKRIIYLFPFDYCSGGVENRNTTKEEREKFIGLPFRETNYNEGHLHGLWKEWGIRNGIYYLHQKSHYKEGKRHGESITYRSTGTVVWIDTYEENRQVHHRSYSEDGILEAEKKWEYDSNGESTKTFYEMNGKNRLGK
jgi:hypothetical protein